jgi:D-psicose/D-tagatose/L-ribulose 3-epimerase
VRLALCNEVVRELTFEAQCALAAKVGYDGLEIAPFTLGAEPHRLPATTIAATRRAAADEGIAISGLHWLLLAPNGLSITSPDADVWQRTSAVIRALIGLCGELGGSYLVHGSPEQRALAGDEAEGRKRALEIFAVAARAAEDAGVVYCLEALSPELTNFVTSLEEAISIVSEIGSPAFRTMIDCAAAGASESEDIPTLLARHLPAGMIRHIHFNDPNRRGPGEGALNFAPIVGALCALRYEGWIGVEPFVYEPDGRSCAARAAGYVRGLEEAITRD